MPLFDISANLGGALATGISMIGQRKREQRAMANEQKLMGVQFGHQQQLNTEAYERQRLLNEQAQMLNMKTWEQTNYPAQIKMLREAGLNPALLYGQGGGPGGSTGGQSGGSAPAGNAAGGRAPAPQPMDLQNMLLGSQIKLMKAQAENVEADTAYKRGETKEPGLVSDELRGRIRINDGIVSLNLSQEELNKASKILAEKEVEVKDSVIKLNNALKKLNDQKTQESISQMNINNKTLAWMKRTGLNPADSQLAKMIQYLGEQTNISEENIIYILGGAIGLERLLKLVPWSVLNKAFDKVTEVKGFR